MIRAASSKASAAVGMALYSTITEGTITVTTKAALLMLVSATNGSTVQASTVDHAAAAGGMALFASSSFITISKGATVTMEGAAVHNGTIWATSKRAAAVVGMALDANMICSIIISEGGAKVTMLAWAAHNAPSKRLLRTTLLRSLRWLSTHSRAPPALPSPAQQLA